MLYVIKKSDNNTENKLLKIEFIKRNNYIFTKKFNYNISMILSDIIFQILIYDILSDDEIIKISDIIIDNYISTYDKLLEIYKFIYNKSNVTINENKTNYENDAKNNIKDFCDYKISLLKLLKVILIIFSNKSIKIPDKFSNILMIMLEEIQIIIFLKNKFFILNSSKYQNNNCNFDNLIIEIIARICIYDKEKFIIVFNNFIISNKLNTEEYIINIMNIMKESLNLIQRSINILFLSIIIYAQGFNFLNNNYDLIFDLFLQIIDELNTPIKPEYLLKYKTEEESLNIEKIENNDNLLQIHNIKIDFIKTLDMVCKSNNVEINMWINNLQINDIKKQKLKDIFIYKLILFE